MPDPLFINASAGAPSYDATELRQAMALALAHGGGQNLGARSGVRPGGTQLETSIAGTTITVQEGVACLYEPTPSVARAPYWVCLPADETHTLTAAHATNPRKDITVLRVYDHDQDSSGLRLARSEYLVGTAAPSPVEPAVPAGAFRLATIDVPASGGGSPVVTINHPFAVAAGGILPVRNSTEEAALAPYDGLVIYRQDTDELKARVNGVWALILTSAGQVGGTQKVWKTADEIVNNSSTMQDDNHLFFTAVAGATYLIEVRLFTVVTGGSSGSDIKIGWNLPGGSINFGGIGPATDLTSAANEGDAGFKQLIGAVTGAVPFGQTGAELPIHLWAYYSPATAGTVTLRWAQQTAVAVDTILRAGSHLLAHRVA